MERELEGIVLSVSDYRENDALVTVLTKTEGKLRMVARGVQKITSKNAGALLTGTLSLFTLQLQEGRELHTLRGARMLHHHRQISASLLKQALASLYCELMLRTEDVADGYALLSAALSDLDEQTDCFTSASVFLNQLCLSQGIAPWVDSCVNCGRKDRITTLSLRQGGFLCVECMDRLQDVPWTRRQLQRFRRLCHAGMDQLDELRACERYDFSDFCRLFAFFREYSGIRIRSFAFLEQVVRMQEGQRS